MVRDSLCDRLASTGRVTLVATSKTWLSQVETDCSIGPRRRRGSAVDRDIFGLVRRPTAASTRLSQAAASTLMVIFLGRAMTNMVVAKGGYQTGINVCRKKRNKELRR